MNALQIEPSSRLTSLGEEHICIYISTWLIGKLSPVSLENKLIIYKTVLKPVWMCGIELWGCASKSNIAVVRRYQSKLLRSKTKAPRYVSNQTINSYLHTPHVPHGFPGTDSYPSHGPGLAPRPSHVTNIAPAKRQELKTKMDI
jgi:hypothetical protein